LARFRFGYQATNPQFIRLPSDDWGLVAWYPNLKRAKAEANGKGPAKPEPEETPEMAAVLAELRTEPPEAKP